MFRVELDDLYGTTHKSNTNAYSRIQKEDLKTYLLLRLLWNRIPLVETVYKILSRLCYHDWNRK